MGLVRFTRGGKSRALREIARYLKSQFKDMGVISVSMNEDTPLSDEEQNDPLTALCLRIAFAARKDKSVQFDAFRNTYYVTRDVIDDWLNSSNEPIVLLVDELNLLEGLGAATQPRPDLEQPRTRMDVPSFLKKNFLVGPNRYFIFTSHVSSTSAKLSVYMDSVSGRTVLIKKLPVVTSLLDARKKLKIPKLSAVMTIYCGLSPALLSSVEILAKTVPKQVDAINKWIDVNSNTVRTLLQTFVSGDSEGVPPSLSYLVDAADGILNKICWIPFYIVAVLRKVRHYEKDCDKGLRMFCKEIVSEFDMFGIARLETGKAWEHLFYLVLYFELHLEKIMTSLIGVNTVCLKRLRYHVGWTTYHLLETSDTNTMIAEIPIVFWLQSLRVAEEIILQYITLLIMFLKHTIYLSLCGMVWELVM
jgi:hypothetical protein